MADLFSDTRANDLHNGLDDELQDSLDGGLSGILNSDGSSDVPLNDASSGLSQLSDNKIAGKISKMNNPSLPHNSFILVHELQEQEFQEVQYNINRNRGDRLVAPVSIYVILLTMTIIITFIIACSTIFIGYQRFMNVNERLVTAIRSIAESEEKMEQRLEQFQSLILKQLSNAEKISDKMTSEKVSSEKKIVLRKKTSISTRKNYSSSGVKLHGKKNKKH